MKNIAIVGGGLAGSSTLRALLTHPKFKEVDRITIFEATHSLGAGMPYDKDSHVIGLNLSADAVSVKKDEPDDFIKWLDQNYQKRTNLEGVTPRPVYGEYLNERFHPYFKHDQVKVVHSSVEDLKILNQQGIEARDSEPGPYLYDLYTDQEGWLNETFDTVFFAIGHPPYADYYDLRGEENYIHDPYTVEEKLSEFKREDKIGIIGSGATGIDVMRYLIRNEDLEAPPTFYVRDEPFYMPSIPLEREFTNFSLTVDWLKKELEEGKGLIPLRHIWNLVASDFSNEGVDPIKVYSKYKEGTLEQFRYALEVKDQDLAYIQGYGSHLTPYLPILISSLNEEDRSLFYDKYFGPLDFLRLVVPTKTFEWILKLLDSERIRVVRGLEEITPVGNGSFKVMAEPEEMVDYVINVTGFDHRLSEAKKLDPLIENLYRKKLILPGYRNEGILVTWPDFQLINNRHGLMENIFFFGEYVASTHYPNDIGNVLRKTNYVVDWYMDHY